MELTQCLMSQVDGPFQNRAEPRMAELERYRDVFTACFGKVHPPDDYSKASIALALLFLPLLFLLFLHQMRRHHFFERMAGQPPNGAPEVVEDQHHHHH